MLVSRPKVLTMCIRMLRDNLAGKMSRRELERALRETQAEQLSLGLGAADVGTRRAEK